MSLFYLPAGKGARTEAFAMRPQTHESSPNWTPIEEVDAIKPLVTVSVIERKPTLSVAVSPVGSVRVVKSHEISFFFPLWKQGLTM